MTIRSALTENGCKIIKVNCTCPFAGRAHKNNGQYVTVTGDRAYLKCSNPANKDDPGCEGQRKLLDWRPAQAHSLRLVIRSRSLDGSLLPT